MSRKISKKAIKKSKPKAKPALHVENQFKYDFIQEWTYPQRYFYHVRCGRKVRATLRNSFRHPNDRTTVQDYADGCAFPFMVQVPSINNHPAYMEDQNYQEAREHVANLINMVGLEGPNVFDHNPAITHLNGIRIAAENTSARLDEVADFIIKFQDWLETSWRFEDIFTVSYLLILFEQIELE